MSWVRHQQGWDMEWDPIHRFYVSIDSPLLTDHGKGIYYPSQQMHEWFKDNLGENANSYWSSHNTYFFFYDDDKAMMFKLAWCER